jgi:hypothetical protein
MRVTAPTHPAPHHPTEGLTGVQPDATPPMGSRELTSKQLFLIARAVSATEA